MMLSPQAARMGTVFTTLRRIGVAGFLHVGDSAVHSRRVMGHSAVSPLHTIRLPAAHSLKSYFLPFSDNLARRHKSSRAACCSFDEEVENSYVDNDVPMSNSKLDMTPTIHHRLSSAVSEPWTINLGRCKNHEWLVGPRDPQDWFTGVAPVNNCPGTDEHGVIRSLPLPNLSAVTRRNAKEYFDNSWTLYETLFAGFNGEEGFYRPPPHGLRHPQIFYYGHTACLYVNKLRLSGVLDQPVNAYFEKIFEIGVDEMLWDDMHKNDMLWPTVSEVHKYRKDVYKRVADLIMNHPSLDDSQSPVTIHPGHPMWALFMGFEHERIHLETSSVLFRETPYHLVQAPENWPPMHPSAYRKNSPKCFPIEGKDYPPNRMLPVQSNTVDLGKPADFPSFGWDNEYGERKVEVPPFTASEHMITNGEFWQFVRDGGYRDSQYWSDDGWAWHKHRNLKWPFFWEPAGPAGSHEFNLRTIFEIIAMPWDWPVDVTYYEAKAYCAWKTAKEGSGAEKPFRVLTEAEHHLLRHRENNLAAARESVAADKVMVSSGQDYTLGSTGANLNMAYSSQNPVGFFAPSETGHRDTTGSAWEWTEDHFNPFKGFEIHHVYDDFSTPCFDGKHSMIVGGSFMSTGDEASVFARFHFRPHFLQHSGFRLVASNHDAPAKHLYAGNFDGQAAARDAVLAASSSTGTTLPTNDGPNGGGENIYETEGSVHMYLGLHYPSSGNEEGVPPIFPHENAPHHGLRFPQRVVGLLNHLCSSHPEASHETALDIGCAVGGASFELAKSYNHVDAFDFSSAFVEAAKQMQSYPDTVRFRIPIEAELFEEVKAVHESDVTEQVRSKVNFFTGDACKISEMALSGKLGSYDAVVMSNLLCRLPDPITCLNDLSSIVNKGGIVVMVTPFSWLTEFTPRYKWLGGFQDPVSKENILSKDVLRKVMEKHGFEKIHEESMPLVIREHQRKYQYIISDATGWRKIK